MTHIKGPKEGRYYCMDCDSWFDTPHEERVDEPRGEFWGVPCTETCYYWYCPYCGSEDIADTEDTWSDVVIDEDDDEEQDN